MTKSELIEGLKDLDDDAEVHVYCTSFDMSGGQYAYDKEGLNDKRRT